MFGVKAVQEANGQLSRAIDNWARVIVTLDPVIREIYIYQYEQFISGFEMSVFDFERTQEPRMGLPLVLPPNLEAAKNVVDLYKRTLKEIKTIIEKEKYEGENYLGIGGIYTIDGSPEYKNSLSYKRFKKRLRQVREDFPNPYAEAKEETEEAIDLSKKSDDLGKPVNDDSFSLILFSLSRDLVGIKVLPILIAIHFIASNCNPKKLENSNAALSSSELAPFIYKKVSTKNGLLDILNGFFEKHKKSVNGEYVVLLKESGSDEADVLNYSQFFESIDVNYLLFVLGKCWERACETGEVFHESEVKLIDMMYFFQNKYKEKTGISISYSEELEKLASLKDKKILTEEEYEVAKARLFS